MQNPVTITMSEDATRAVLRAVSDDPDRTKWGHHQWLRIEAETALAAATEGGDRPQPGSLAYAQMVAEQHGDLDDETEEETR